MAFFGLGLGTTPKSKKKPQRRGQISIETLRDMRCKACPLNSAEKHLHHPKMEATGSSKPLIYVLGEAPGCIAGDSLVDTAFRDKSKYPDGIPIRDLVGRKNFYVYSFDVQTQKLVLGKVKRVWRTGRKKVYRVTYEWKYADRGTTIYLEDSLVVTANHKFLLKRPKWKDPFKGSKHADLDYLSIEEGLDVGYSLQPFLRRSGAHGRGYVGISAKETVNEARFLLGYKIGRELNYAEGQEECHHINENKQDDSYENLELHTTSTHARHHLLKNNPMSRRSVRIKHRSAVRSDEYRKEISQKTRAWLATPEGRAARMKQLEETNPARSVTVKNLHKDPVYKYRYLMSRKSRWKNWSLEDVERRFKKAFPHEPFPPVSFDNHVVTKIEYLGVQNVYDMEIRRYHNFAVNGVFVHNSDEDEQGVQFIGASGQILRSQIPEKYEDRIRWNNTIRCHPPKNRNPMQTETECCRNFIVEDIEKAKPKAIFVFGGVPLNWLNASDGITRWRGRYSPVKVGSHTCWAFYFLHPAYVLRTRRKNKSGKVQKSELEFVFNRDLKRAFKLLQKLPDPIIGEPLESPPTADKRSAKGNPYPNGPTRSMAPSRGVSSYPDARGRTFSGVRYVTGAESSDLDRVVEWLEYLKDKPSFAFDLETTTDEKISDRQTRPYGEGARILSVALACNGESFAFPIHHKQAGWSTIRRKEIEGRFISLLKNYKGIKIAHNLAFELEWLAFFYGKELVYAGLWGDTMGQAYVLDERRGMLGLDDLTLQHFGFDLKTYFAHLSKGNLDNEDIRDVLVYNGLDSLWEHKLYAKQRKLLKQEGLWEVYQNHIPPIQTSVLTQLFGSKINFDLVNKLGDKYEAEAKRLTDKIRRYKAVRRFEEWKGKEFNPSSHAHVVDLFKVILERPECKNEETGKYSADDEVLKKIGTPLAEDIRQYRGVTGNKSKYIDPLRPEAKECIFPDGRVHSNLHIFFTKTGRTSSSFVNQQYWPKRDEEFKDLRAEFEAEDDCWMVAIDQGQIEARVIQMAAKDKRYGEYLWNRQDVHMDWTIRLAHAYPRRIGGKKFIGDKDVMKAFRHDVKNQWTFPLFFGCSAYSAARYLSMPIEVVDPLVDKFWQEFSGVKSWQEELEDFYHKSGYVETLTGRRRRAPITHNELINSPIQGTASDITVNAWSRLSKAAADLGMWQFQARLEVHDELVFHIPKKTFDRDLEFIIDHLLDCEHFDFINVPLSVEVNRGPNWYEQKHVMTVFSDDLNKIRREDHI